MNINPAILGIAISVIGLMIAYITYLRNSRKDCEMQAKEDGTLNSDIEYIKRRIDDVLLAQKELNNTVSEHAVRLALVEASTKSAHYRLDDHILKRKAVET